MLDFPKLYSNKKLMTNMLLLSALLNKKYKVFNCSLELKLSKGKKIPLLKMVYNYAVKNNEYDIAINCANRILKELKNKDNQISAIKDYEKRKVERLNYFYSFFKTLIRTENNEMFKKLMYESTEELMFLNKDFEKNSLFLLSMKADNEDFAKMILNNRYFSIFNGTVSDSETFFKGLLIAFKRKRYDICSIAYNSLSYLRSVDKYRCAIHKLIDYAVLNGELDIFKKENALGEMKFKLNADIENHLKMAIDNGNLNSIILLLNFYEKEDMQKKLRLNICEWRGIICLAIKKNNEALVDYFLDKERIKLEGDLFFLKIEGMVMYVINKSIKYMKIEILEYIMPNYGKLYLDIDLLNKGDLINTNDERFVRVLRNNVINKKFVIGINEILNEMILKKKIGQF